MLYTEPRLYVQTPWPRQVVHSAFACGELRALWCGEFFALWCGELRALLDPLFLPLEGLLLVLFFRIPMGVSAVGLDLNTVGFSPPPPPPPLSVLAAISASSSSSGTSSISYKQKSHRIEHIINTECHNQSNIAYACTHRLPHVVIFLLQRHELLERLRVRHLQRSKLLLCLAVGD
jgi:hypothetical protein